MARAECGFSGMTRDQCLERDCVGLLAATQHAERSHFAHKAHKVPPLLLPGPPSAKREVWARGAPGEPWCTLMNGVGPGKAPAPMSTRNGRKTILMTSPSTHHYLQMYKRMQITMMYNVLSVEKKMP